MRFPERFSNLPEYAFPRLRALLDDVAPGGDVIHMSIGEPRHAMPDFVFELISRHSHEFSMYPPNDGTDGLRTAISNWLKHRYKVDIDPQTQILPLNGSREGLFNAGIAICPEEKGGGTPVVLMPNPFYQVYAVAAVESRAEPVFLPAIKETGYLPDFSSLSPQTLERTAIAYICSPSNPQGAVADRDYWVELLRLAEKYDFVVLADECYSEVYRDKAPTGILEVAKEISVDPERVVAIHSLSKRSNMPGLRSGFAAGGPKTIAEMKKLRAYSGAPLPLPIQHVSEAVWGDEQHVNRSRALYVEKFKVVDEIMNDVPGYSPLKAGFFLWLPVWDGEALARKIWTSTGVRILPGSYLSREVDGVDPGAGYIRAALVAELDEMRTGLKAIRACL